MNLARQSSVGCRHAGLSVTIIKAKNSRRPRASVVDIKAVDDSGLISSACVLPLRRIGEHPVVCGFPLTPSLWILAASNNLGKVTSCYAGTSPRPTSGVLPKRGSHFGQAHCLSRVSIVKPMS